jgi:hypothetical protein
MSTSNSQKKWGTGNQSTDNKGGSWAGLLCPDGLIAQCLYLVKKQDKVTGMKEKCSRVKSP